MGHLLRASLALGAQQWQNKAPALQSPASGGRDPGPPLLPGDSHPGGSLSRPRSDTRGRQVALCACAPAAAPGSQGRDQPARGRDSGGRGRGPRRRLCDFGFDLPGDELIPPYNRLRGDRENGCGAICVAMGTIARARARAHACARARTHTHGRGASPEKYSLCRRRVSLTVRGPLAAGLRSLLPQVQSDEALGPLAGRPTEAGWDPWVLPNSSEDPSTSHTHTPRLGDKHSCYTAQTTPSTVESITPARTILSLWRGPARVSRPQPQAGTGTGPCPLAPLAAPRSIHDRYPRTQPPSRRSVHTPSRTLGAHSW